MHAAIQSNRLANRLETTYRTVLGPANIASGLANHLLTAALFARKGTLACWLSLLAITSFSPQILQAEWNRFRGANGAGNQDQCSVPLPWNAADVAWQIDLPGKGNGSPIVQAGKVFIMSAHPATAERYALAYDLATGKELWRKTYESKTHQLHARSSYASGTPCANEDAVFFAWASPDNLTVRCYSHTGNELKRLQGSMVFELAPVAASKDCAVSGVLGEPPFLGRIPVYLGDDECDEEAFRRVNALGGLSVRVGAPPRPSVARAGLPSVDATIEWLRRLTEAR